MLEHAAEKVGRVGQLTQPINCQTGGGEEAFEPLRFRSMKESAAIANVSAASRVRDEGAFIGFHLPFRNKSA